MENLIEVQNLKKYFKTPGGMLHAVDDVSFGIPKGATMGVVGESGCGKSTLGRTMIHLLDSTDGKIFFEGRDVTDLNKRGIRNSGKMRRLFSRILIPRWIPAIPLRRSSGSLWTFPENSVRGRSRIR